MRGVIIRLGQCREGAVAPTVALSLVGLITVGGLAFDYARLAALDTELQNAADHAALAAASQLDGKTGACQRAASAARTMIQNHALFANDGDGPVINIANEGACDAAGTIRFYQDKEKNLPATKDANANFVEVTVEARKANYALTPIVGAVTSGDLRGTAFAGLSSAICKVPPLMICNPAENSSGGSIDLSDYVGRGILLQAGGGGAWAPGNFGYLAVGDNPGADDLREALGKASTSFPCFSTEKVDTAPGNMAAVIDALNTRFDIYENGWAANCGTTACPPALNTMKDLVRLSTGGCNLNPNNQNGWFPAPGNGTYRPDPATRTDSTVTVMGHPRDICHAVALDGDCPKGRIGDGNWDRATYFRVNHNAIYLSGWQEQLRKDGVANYTNPTRYDVYRWEIATNRLGSRNINGNVNAYSAPICSTKPVGPPSYPDRRVASVAVINCLAQGVGGRSSDVKVEEWADVFLVEPSFNRDGLTAADQIYIEVIGPTEMAGGGGTGNQLVRRDVPYLIE